MFKRIFSFFLLSILSFFLTTLSIKYIKYFDPLMIYLKENTHLYEKDAEDAVLNDFSMLPGRKGVEIDIDKSYNLMKKYGGFNEQLLVYKDIVPTISIFDIYDKYINSGNLDNPNISLIFKIDNYDFINEIVSILKDKDVIGTFFLNDELIYDKNLLIYLYLNNQEVEYYSDKYDFNKLRYIDIYVSSYISKNLSFCYDLEYNKTNIETCSFKRLHMVIPSLNINNHPFYEVSNNLKNGLIISFDNNQMLIKELRYIINYTRQKNYEIVSLKKLLEE